MIIDVWLKPRLARRAGSGAIDQIAVVASAALLADTIRYLGCDDRVPVDVCATATARLRPGGLRHRHGDRVGDKDQASLVCFLPQCLECLD
jgi:hypothetical protein